MSPILAGALMGCAVAVPALVVAIMSSGLGHGDYFVAKLVFPFTMLSTLVFGSITPPFIVVAIAQYPVYGIVYGAAVAKRWRVVMFLLAVVHIAAVATCIFAPMPGFS